MEFNLAAVHEAIAEAQPGHPCIRFRGRTLSWGEVTTRTRRLAAYLRLQGLGRRRCRHELHPHESGQDHVALYLHNGPEYLEGMLGAFKARCAPFNVNYRYVGAELRYLLSDARATAIIYHARFAPVLAELLPALPGLRVLLQVDDGSGEPLLDGAVDYGAALSAVAPEAPVGLSADDLYILYTGGTTGMPKGVLWRQGDLFVASLGGRDAEGEAHRSLAAVVAQAVEGRHPRVCAPPPMMHGAAHWAAFHAFHMGGTVVIQDRVDRLDPDELWATVAREKVHSLLLVGDAFGRPLADALDTGAHELRALKPLRTLVNSGAALSEGVKRRLLAHLPHARIVDAIGASESGQQGVHVSAGAHVGTGTFVPTPGTCLLPPTLDRVLPTSPEVEGFFARTGAVPLGYYRDPDKTARTFPRIGGVRYAVPGDRARYTADGHIQLLGRDSATINSGGEKIFAEEVEAALVRHPGVYDAVVCGAPSERWGQEVCAVVQPVAGAMLDLETLREACGAQLARYKLPRRVRFVERVERSPSGKADYRWARRQFEPEPD